MLDIFTILFSFLQVSFSIDIIYNYEKLNRGQILKIELFHYICGACIYGSGNVPPALLHFAIFCAKNLILVIPIHIIYMSFANLKISSSNYSPSLPLRLIAMLLMACLVSFIIGLIFYEPRPFVTMPNLTLLKHRDSSSFPSNHAMVFSVYLYFIVNYYKELKFNKIILPFAILFMMLTCWARIFTAIHYPIDILGGIMIGMICATIVNKTINKFFKNKVC